MQQFIKWFLIALPAVAVIILLVPAFLPKQVHIERSLYIGREPETVFSVVSDLNQYPQWDPFGAQDPSVKFQVSGSGVGSTYEWDGKKIGKGRMVITKLDAPHLVQVHLSMGNSEESLAEWRLQPSGQGTQVVWAFDTELPYVMRYFGLVMDRMLGSCFEQGLANLKRTVEK
ncbi:MAG TPA: SRPBCC family protein [Oculatellaceae cyanobacterium]|jgi:uncharacterized protein YndB with AHSA1/START domain